MTGRPISPDSRRARKAIETRARLAETARTVFSDLGYEEATMRKLAKAAGVSTGALFGYWSGKAELYREATGRAPPTQEIIEVLAKALSDVLPYAEACVGLPRNLWPQDSVILAAERALAQAQGDRP